MNEYGLENLTQKSLNANGQIEICTISTNEHLKMNIRKEPGRFIKTRILLRATNNTKLWRVLIVCILKRQGLYKYDHLTMDQTGFSIH